MLVVTKSMYKTALIEQFYHVNQLIGFVFRA
jgi:hypothetical protein